MSIRDEFRLFCEGKGWLRFDEPSVEATIDIMTIGAIHGLRHALRALEFELDCDKAIGIVSAIVTEYERNKDEARMARVVEDVRR